MGDAGKLAVRACIEISVSESKSIVKSILFLETRETMDRIYHSEMTCEMHPIGWIQRREQPTKGVTIAQAEWTPGSWLL